MHWFSAKRNSITALCLERTSVTDAILKASYSAVTYWKLMKLYEMKREYSKMSQVNFQIFSIKIGREKKMCCITYWMPLVLSNDTLHDLCSHLKFQSWLRILLLVVYSEKWKYHQLILYIGLGHDFFFCKQPVPCSSQDKRLVQVVGTSYRKTASDARETMKNYFVIPTGWGTVVSIIVIRSTNYMILPVILYRFSFFLIFLLSPGAYSSNTHGSNACRVATDYGPEY